jgi:hypothetical protein
VKKSNGKPAENFSRPNRSADSASAVTTLPSGFCTYPYELPSHRNRRRWLQGVRLHLAVAQRRRHWPRWRSARRATFRLVRGSPFHETSFVATPRPGRTDPGRFFAPYIPQGCHSACEQDYGRMFQLSYATRHRYSPRSL